MYDIFNDVKVEIIKIDINYQLLSRKLNETFDVFTMITSTDYNSTLEQKIKKKDSWKPIYDKVEIIYFEAFDSVEHLSPNMPPMSPMSSVTFTLYFELPQNKSIPNETCTIQKNNILMDFNNSLMGSDYDIILDFIDH